MIKNKVLHFVRKNSQLESSFINNQIIHHNDFEPFIILRENDSNINNNGFTDLILKEYNFLDLSENETITEKIRFKTIKTLSKRQLIIIKDFIKKNGIDICHFHYGTDCGVFYPLQTKLRIPSVVSFYGYDAFSFPERFWGYGKKYLNERVFSKVNCILAMTPEMKKDLIRIGCTSEKIEIHYHGVPSNIFSRIKKKYSQVNNEFTLLNISYFDPVKGHIFIFKALKQLIERGSKIKLRIGGNGFFESKLKEFVNNNQLGEFISFLGPLKYGSREMINEYKSADAFVYPSVITKDDKEGIPGAIVEAMFAGLPVVSTYHGGIPFIIENEKTGLLVNEWDVAGLASAIYKLMIDKELREKLGQAAREYALNYLDLQEKEKDLESIYSKVIYNNYKNFDRYSNKISYLR
jgi:colanic acid/amylovoran biosynthesis glycosyltransferase